jgi:hypothetical protein
LELHFHIGEDLEEFLRAFAAARSITLSAAVRIILYDRFSKENQNAHAADR